MDISQTEREKNIRSKYSEWETRKLSEENNVTTEHWSE